MPDLKARALEFIKSNPGGDVGDVALELKIRLEEASAICKELREEGRIGYALKIQLREAGAIYDELLAENLIERIEGL